MPAVGDAERQHLEDHGYTAKHLKDETTSAQGRRDLSRQKSESLLPMS